jgi:LmbE family N-acetylglucosaminyl deacetylase
VTESRNTALHVAPHPDDELLGAPATLMALRDAGWRIVNLACSLGRPADAPRRRAELTEACRRAGFELVIPDPLPSLGENDELTLARARLATEIQRAAASLGADLILGPCPDDAHHGHQVAGRAIVDAVESRGEPAQLMFWSLWRDPRAPNLLVPFSSSRLAEIRSALAAHAGELERNRFDRLLEGRAMAQAVLGPERIFGHGGRGIAESYAEVLTHMSWSPADGWRRAAPRVFDPALLLEDPVVPSGLSGGESSDRSSSSRSGRPPSRR